VDPSLDVRPFVPHRQVPQWYGRTDLVLLPYQSKPAHVASICPIKLFEAMAAGRPILVSDMPTIREWIEHETNGLLVDPDDPQAWRAAIERLRGDRELAATLARNARAAAPRYTWLQRARGIADAVGLERDVVE
jgi:glycosyltransferase involved in cell wall biosynthesis